MLEMIFVIVVGAAALGIIIAVMEEGEFPGWGRMCVCVVVTSVVSAVAGALIPVGNFVLGPVVGAVVGGGVISATCGMSVGRASIAAGIYLAIQIALGWGVYLLMR